MIVGSGGLRLCRVVLVLVVVVLLSTPTAVRADHDLSSQQIVFTIVAFVLGIITCFFGYRLIKHLLFLAGFVIVGGIVFLILESHTSIHIWAIIAISCIAGVGGGLSMIFLTLKVAFFVMGALLGAVLAMYIQTTASGGLIHSQVGKWCFIGAIALAGAICTLLLAKPLLIILTSIAGAYAAMIAVDTWNGGQLSQAFRDVFNRRDADNIVHLSKSSQILLGIAAVLAVCGMLAQFLGTARFYHHDPDKRKKLQKKKKRSSGN